ncbi:MAG: TlpA family protein disulfide reductase [Nannocystaceae bacterium]|nr:TlpA family protein disulfide reductase [bacterium]
MRRTLIALLLVGAACEGKGTTSSEASVALEPSVRFEGKTTDGKDVSLADYEGKVVLVNVWASWCGPCKKELPELQKMHHAYGDDFAVLGVSIDKARNHQAVRGLMRQFGIDYPVVLDTDGLSVQAFGVQGYPTSVLIDRNGVIRWRREGIIEPGDTEAQTAIRAAIEAG